MILLAYRLVYHGTHVSETGDVQGVDKLELERIINYSSGLTSLILFTFLTISTFEPCSSDSVSRSIAEWNVNCQIN